MVVKVIFLNILFLLISGCAQKQASFSDVDGHIMKSSELRLLMRELSSIMDDRHESELERDSIRRRYALRLSNSVKEYSSQIKNIPKEKFGKNMDKADMKIFYAYVKELDKKADILHDIADSYELEKLDSAISNMQRTCNACHRQLRR